MEAVLRAAGECAAELIFLIFFLPSAAYLLLRFSCVTGTVCPLAGLSLELQCWGEGDMSTVGTMKLPVWFAQSVCKHPGGVGVSLCKGWCFTAAPLPVG